MNGHHPDDRSMQAFVDGELPPADADRVQAHLRGCAACAARRNERLALVDALRADAGERPLRPVWPHVRARMPRRVRFDLPFALGAGLAVTAGLLLGVALGTTTTGSDSSAVASSSAISSTSTMTTDDVMSWSSWGSALPDVYGLTESEGSGS